MKNIGLTFLMLLFVGVTATMAQDKTTEDSDANAVKTEVKAEGHKCASSCKMTCCAKKTAAEKKACAADCKKACCASKGKQEDHDHDSHEGHDHGTPN